MVKKQNFGHKAKFQLKIKFFVKNRNIGQKIKFLVKNPNFGQKSKF